MTPRLRAVLIAVLALSALLAPTAAEARVLLSTSVSAPRSEDRSCTSRLLGGAAQPAKTLTAPAVGWLTARLEGDGPGDWDLAVFESNTGRLVGGSTAFGAVEVAQGIVGTGAPLAVQACRRSGDSRTAKLTVTLAEVADKPAAKAQLVRISVPSRDRNAELEKLGLDLTEHARPGYREAVLYGAKDAQRLRDAKFTFVVEVSDLVAKDRAARARERRASSRALPSGRTGTYRRLPDYGNDMKKLVRENPGLVKPIVLENTTYSIKLPNGQSDVRRKVFRLNGGRFTARPDFYRRDTCGLLRSYKLERAAFGGSTRRPLRAAFRLTRAGTVRVEVLRGAKVVKTLVRSKRFAAGRTHRASLPSAGLRKGDYKVRITVRRAGSRTATSTLTTRKL